MATTHKDYSGTPLPKKLGIVSAKMTPQEVALIAPPDGFAESLGELPESVEFSHRLTPTTTLALCFVRTQREVAEAARLLADRLPKTAAAWIVWPKARLKPGFNGNDVRDAALAMGLVDYKVCSVNDDWSGLKFAHRKR
jgi:hypothetical protein